ncbi:outer membrane murein-binding lipoprotein Lpp [Nocardiopsis mwathae]|uniref:Outer membrane murein-binding lipoprotein Lpp n=1 Tax=Nocardiopsis mwathae TaxID=1472723 RepID=A0A7W9YJ00_9ACTN|nr:outer membrane murein-binding lipoprotein Lpp [Nocardiopsis mwathae]
MSLVYRSIVTVPQDHDVIASTSAVLSEWLSKRGTAGARVDFARSGAYELSKRSRAMVLRHENPDEDITFLRLTTESDKPDGVWRTTVTAVRDPKRLTHRYIWIDMTVDPRAGISGSERLDIAPPDAVRMLLDKVPGFDGGHRLPAVPHIVRGKDDTAVRTLLDSVNDPDRRLAIVVTAAPEDMTVAGWCETMGSVLARSTGMCAGYVLDAAAHEALGRILPRGFDVPAGGVRTFLPRVDLNDAADSLRHPRMSAQTLDTARDGDRVRAWVSLALARSVRDNALESPLPPALHDIDALLNEEEIDAFIHDAEDDPSVPSRPSPVAAGGDQQAADFIELLRTRLADKSHEANRLSTEAKRLGTRLAEQVKENERLNAELTELTEETDAARESLHAAQHEIAWLRERLCQEGLYRLATESPPPDPRRRPPHKVEDLLDRITDGSNFPHLYFTIEDHDTVRELTGSRKENLWVARAWEALLALDDYARFQLENPGSGLNFHGYLREPPDGYRAIPVRRLASRESDHVRNREKLSEKRVFKVPHEVDPRGEVPMFAHIKLDTEYGICPRLYFYPHLGPQTTNRIYIGYLGRHLPVQRTN